MDNVACRIIQQAEVWFSTERGGHLGFYDIVRGNEGLKDMDRKDRHPPEFNEGFTSPPGGRK